MRASVWRQPGWEPKTLAVRRLQPLYALVDRKFTVTITATIMQNRFGFDEARQAILFDELFSISCYLNREANKRVKLMLASRVANGARQPARRRHGGQAKRPDVATKPGRNRSLQRTALMLRRSFFCSGGSWCTS